ncbi:hypothetical protein [Serratia fonticola]|uniref:hypothetical protein n=1 Tax=Serratia fonticola TaxID=47917 RepID=UPI001378B068|nr:hypothetical protein [Serratia fonticola]NCG51961.1 hypothetical protein [Serratia fonticola]
MRIGTVIAGAMLLVSAVAANSAETPLGGVPVSVMLTNQPKMTVRKPGGGWYDILALSNAAGSDVTRFQAQVSVEVGIRNERNFMVSLLEPLVLTHQTESALVFTTENISFGSNGAAMQTLSVTPVDFINPPLVGDTSTGNYLLSISARQPTGRLGNISGDYQGELVLMFEVKA